MTGLSSLWLQDNQLTGSIPPELGNLTHLVTLYLSNNQLTGTIPSQLSHTNLRSIAFDHNPLTGALPLSLTGLGMYVDELWFDGTDLCEPDDLVYQFWLRTAVSDLRRTGMICGTAR